MKPLQVVPHDPHWPDAFESEAKIVATAFGENVVATHHIGSTSIPNIFSKPVIDMLIEVKEITNVDLRSSEMEWLGYEVKGEFGIPGRRYFRKDNAKGDRTHQIHVFKAGAAEAERHLAFRDYLKSHPIDAQKYSELKRSLAAKHPMNPAGYIDGKDPFIKEIDRKAAEWLSLQTR